jgi:hypothetical protein
MTHAKAGPLKIRYTKVARPSTNTHIKKEEEGSTAFTSKSIK